MEEQQAAQQGSWIEPIKQYFLDFGVLKDNPMEFWAIQIINFLDMAAYFSMISIITLFLTDNIGWNDVNAGYIVTAFTMFVTISLFFSGFITDSLGIKASLILAMIIQGVTRFGVLMCGLLPDLPGRQWLVILSLVLTAPGMAMTQTVFQAANKRFSTTRSRSASFNIWYLVMNVGAIIGGLMIDWVRLVLKIDNSYIFAFATGAAVLSILTAIVMIRRETQAGKPETSPETSNQDGEEAGRKEEKKGAWQIFREVTAESAFWRFIVLMAALLGVRAIFLYMYLLMPKFWVRVIGPDVEMGLLQTINPVLIVIGLVLFIPIANKFNVFKMLVFGAIISSFSLFVLILPYNWFSGDVATAFFWMSVIMLVVLSMGEVIWSPKLQEYTAAIAPRGQEGSYLGMSMMPWFFAKLLVSAMSGHMLAKWVPEGTGENLKSGHLTFWQSPSALWLILFLWALSGPILALVFKGWLTKGANLDPPAKKEKGE
ncbi:MAG: MFS transporter [Deltaproteobacteria bacterium]|nr:MFS transporter [Deltaproteobacteria bacterium]